MPYKRWKTEHRSPWPDNIVLVLYKRKVGKGEYRLGRVLKVHPDSHGIVRTVTVGMRGKDRGKTLTYVPKPLDQYTLGVQRITVILPVEEQDLEASEDGAGADS